MANNLKITQGADTDVAAQDRNSVYYQVVQPNALSEDFLQACPAVVTDNSAHTILAAQGGALKIYLTTIVVTNSDATVGTLVTIQDEDDAPLCRGYAASAGGGFSATFPVPPSTGANKALEVICGTTSAEVYVTVSGYKGP
jgi:hypothetical protein